MQHAASIDLCPPFQFLRAARYTCQALSQLPCHTLWRPPDLLFVHACRHHGAFGRADSSFACTTMAPRGGISRHNFGPQLKRLRQSMKEGAIKTKPVEISRDDLELGEMIGKGTDRAGRLPPASHLPRTPRTASYHLVRPYTAFTPP